LRHDIRGANAPTGYFGGRDETPPPIHYKPRPFSLHPAPFALDALTLWYASGYISQADVLSQGDVINEQKLAQNAQF